MFGLGTPAGYPGVAAIPALVRCQEWAEASFNDEPPGLRAGAPALH